MFKLNKFICFIAILLSFSSCKAPNESFNDESNKESQSESLSEEKKYLLTFDDNGHEIFQGHSLTLFTNLFCNNEEIYNYTVTYTSLDDTIFSVSLDGVVTGFIEGST